jgi:hypothetical protein
MHCVQGLAVPRRSRWTQLSVFVSVLSRHVTRLASRRRRWAAGAATTAAARDRAKRAHYACAGVGEAYDLVPLSVESFGRLGKPAMGLLNPWRTWRRPAGGVSCGTARGRSQLNRSSSPVHKPILGPQRFVSQRSCRRLRDLRRVQQRRTVAPPRMCLPVRPSWRRSPVLRVPAAEFVAAAS